MRIALIVIFCLISVCIYGQSIFDNGDTIVFLRKEKILNETSLISDGFSSLLILTKDEKASYEKAKKDSIEVARVIHVSKRGIIFWHDHPNFSREYSGKIYHTDARKPFIAKRKRNSIYFICNRKRELQFSLKREFQYNVPWGTEKMGPNEFHSEYSGDTSIYFNEMKIDCYKFYGSTYDKMTPISEIDEFIFLVEKSSLIPIVVIEVFGEIGLNRDKPLEIRPLYQLTLYPDKFK